MLPVAVVLCASRGVVTRKMDVRNMTIRINEKRFAIGLKPIRHPQVSIRMFWRDLATPLPRFDSPCNQREPKFDGVVASPVPRDYESVILEMS